MKKNFQYILLGIFIVVGVFAVLVFSGVFSKGSGSSDQTVDTSPVTLWGVYPQTIISRAVQEGKITFPVTFQYTQINPETFEDDLVEALASGKGPDAIIAPLSLTLSQADKLYTIPWQSIPERTMRDTFIGGAESFWSSAGINAFPMFSDPLIMYWNRTLFTNAGLATPPRTWDEFLTLPKKLTVLDERKNITQSTVALGGYRNITGAKDLLSAFILQTGDDIVTRDSNGAPSVVFGNSRAETESALRFYTDFANPAKTTYSWNTALPASFEVFAGGKLAVYFGHASEFGTIRARNPHLDFDVATLPQIKGTKERTTFGTFYGFALLKNSPRLSRAYQLGYSFAFGQMAPHLSSQSTYSSVRRDILARVVADPYKTIFNSAALESRAWLDRDPAKTDKTHRDMIDTITVGRLSTSQAIGEARASLINAVGSR